MLSCLKNAEIFGIERDNNLHSDDCNYFEKKYEKKKKKYIYFESVRSHVARQASLMSVNDN